MSSFFEYFKSFMAELFRNLGKFFANIFVNPWRSVPGEFRTYNNILNAYKGEFGFWGWLLYVISIICLVAIVALLVFAAVLVIKKYIKFYKREFDKDRQDDEVARLQYELIRTTNEKDRILNLKFGTLNALPGSKDGTEGAETDDTDATPTGNRFAKLGAVDAKYVDYDASVDMTETDMLSLDQLVQRFRNFAASQLGLFYESKAIRAFFSGLGTTKLLILEGISGTGKTSLPYAFGKFFQNDAKIVSVQPSWRDRSELLGYYNEFTKKFNETDFLRAIYEATYRNDINIVILDEMNLARIEYYFAEFLSIMEMPNISEWNIELINTPIPATDPKHFKEGKMLIPQNIWFIGTANNDDSTFTITDKVYDRAISIFFNNKGIPFEHEFTEPVNLKYDYLDTLFREAKSNYPVTQKLLEKFDKLDSFIIAKFKLAFGNRILKQLKAFIPCYVASGGTELEALDFIFATKILKKFQVLNVAFLKNELKELLNELDKQFGRNSFTDSRVVIEGLMKSS